MIINTQFFITYYTGKTPLKITTIPDNLSDTQMVEYNRFIQSVSVIYASQNLGSVGDIPKFWTTLVQSSDGLGNIEYKYVPHPDCDLTELNPKSSYYFIIRDESALPIRIPAAGGSLLGFTDNTLLPVVDNTTIRDVVLNSDTGNVATLNIGLKQLQAYEEYVYTLKSIDTNWPINVYGLSGTIKSGSDTASINSRLVFCPSTGSCGPNILDYSLQESCLFNNKNLYSILQLAIQPISYDGPEILSNQFIVTCDDCLPTPQINMTGDSDKIISFDQQNNALGYYNFNLSFNDLQPNQTYSYFVETFNSEWPTFFVGNSSGTITTSNNGLYPNAPINTKLVFCKSTTLCPSDQQGINDYTTPNYPSLWRSGLPYNIGIRACLSASGCGGYTNYSDPIVLSYLLDKKNTQFVDLVIGQPVLAPPAPPPAPPPDSILDDIIDSITDLVPGQESVD